MKKIFLICLTLALVACLSEEHMEFQENRAIWKEAKPSHYRYQLNFMCICSFFESMPLVIEIQDNEIVYMEPFSGGALSAEDRQYLEENGTIDQVFKRLGAAIRQDPDELEVRYNLDYGFPAYISVDFSKNYSDEGFALSISEFEVLP